MSTDPNLTGPAPRRNRLVVLGAAAVVALAVVAVLVLAGGDSGDDRSVTAPPSQDGRRPGEEASRPMLEGIAQDGIVLGDSDAKVTLVAFTDLQCPFCKQFASQALPLIVRDYVATGKVRLEYRDLAFLGDGSVTAASAAAAAGAQDRLWNFVDLFYDNQGEESSGYVTDAFVQRLYRATPGLDVDAANARRRAGAEQEIAAARALARRFAIDSTPAFALGRTGGALRRLETGSLDYEDFQRALDPLVGE